jgi:hypothetical protein
MCRFKVNFELSDNLFIHSGEIGLIQDVGGWYYRVFHFNSGRDFSVTKDIIEKLERQ